MAAVADAINEDLLFAAASPAGFGWVATRGEIGAYRPARFHAEIAKAVVDVTEGRLDVLVLQVPVRHGKTTTASVLTAAWYLGVHPERYVIAVTYGTDFSADKIGKPSRDLLERHGPRLFQVGVDPGSSAKDRWDTTRGGGLVALGIEKATAGRGADLLIVDDPYPNLEFASSKSQRDKAFDVYRFELASRLSPVAGQVHIMSRWGDDDHVARVIALCKEIGLRFRVIDFPALAICAVCGSNGIGEVNECGHGVRDSLGRLPGEALWPEVRDRSFLIKQRGIVGPRAFDALYQGRPRPDGGHMFGAADFRYATIVDGRLILYADDRTKAYMLRDCRIFQMVDPAASTDPNAARFRIGTFAMTPERDLVIIDMQGGTIGAPRAEKLVKAQYLLHQPMQIGVEKNGLGLPIVQHLVDDGLPIRPILTKKDKVVNAATAQVWYGNHKMFHLKGAPWLNEFEEELKSFPGGTYKDQVDVVSMAAIAVSSAAASGGPPMGVRIG